MAVWFRRLRLAWRVLRGDPVEFPLDAPPAQTFWYVPQTYSSSTGVNARITYH